MKSIKSTTSRLKPTFDLILIIENAFFCRLIFIASDFIFFLLSLYFTIKKFEKKIEKMEIISLTVDFVGVLIFVHLSNKNCIIVLN